MVERAVALTNQAVKGLELGDLAGAFRLQVFPEILRSLQHADDDSTTPKENNSAESND